jgi:hypothetical protein
MTIFYKRKDPDTRREMIYSKSLECIGHLFSQKNWLKWT